MSLNISTLNHKAVVLTWFGDKSHKMNKVINWRSCSHVVLHLSFGGNFTAGRGTTLVPHLFCGIVSGKKLPTKVVKVGNHMVSGQHLMTPMHIVCTTAYYTLKNVVRIHNLFTPEVAKIIIQGLVISKLDYCNGQWAWSIKSWVKISYRLCKYIGYQVIKI